MAITANRGGASTAGSDGSLMRLSARLGWMHALGLTSMIGVVTATLLWQASEHNEEAQRDARRLVSAGVASLEVKLETFVRDYSVWNEAYEAAHTADRDWLYANLGTAVTELDALDLLIVTDGDSLDVGWRPDSPVEGQAALLSDQLFGSLLEPLPGRTGEDGRATHTYAWFDDQLWLFALAEIVPFGDATRDPDRQAVYQIHGLIIDDATLDEIGSVILKTAMQIDRTVPDDRHGLPVTGVDGATVAYVTWIPPTPGLDVLSKLAAPIGIVVCLMALIGAFSSRTVRSAARRLEDALVAARAADRAKTEFLANISHELRTPMNAVLNLTEFLRETKLDEEQREMLDVVQGAAEDHMLLLSNLLSVSVIEEGRQNLTKTPFKVEDILRPIASTAALTARDKGVQVELTEQEVGQVLGDPGAVRQIVSNLVQNAVKFTDEGSIRISLSAELSDEAARLVISVADTGTGIPPDQQARIFERFTQVDQTLSRAADGAGLGLSISQSLASAMGGVLTVESDLGQGATFSFHVTLDRAERLQSMAAE